MSNVKLTCPVCLAEFNASEQLEEHFQNMESQKEVLNSKDNEIDGLKTIISKLRKDVEEAKVSKKNDLKPQLDKAMEKGYQDGFKAKELNLERIKKEAKEAAKEEIKKENKLDEEQIFQKGLLKGEQINHDNHEKERMEDARKIKALTLQLSTYKEKINEANRSGSIGNVETQGEAQELIIENLMEKFFPRDDIQPVKKGANGPDIILSVNNNSNQCIGKIAIESKDAIRFDEDWVKKLSKDMTNNNINFGIIVSRKSPKNFKHIEWRLDNKIAIIECKESSIKLTTEIIRELVVNEHKIKRVSRLSNSERDELYKRMLSPQMGLLFTNLMRSCLSAQDLIDDESKNQARFKTKKENINNLKKQQILDIIGAISGNDTKLSESLIGALDSDNRTDNLIEIDLNSKITKQ